MKEAIKFAPL